MLILIAKMFRLWLYLEEGKMEAIAKGASDAGNLKEEAEKERERPVLLSIVRCQPGGQL